MAHPSITIRSALLACLLAASQTASHGAEESVRVVFQNGRSIPITSLALQGDKLVLLTEFETFKVGHTFAFTSADHVYGVKPAAIKQAVTLLLAGKPKDAEKLLEPVVSEQRITGKIPGNFWLEAARAMLVAYAVNGQSKECGEIGKEISEATPAQGVDPFVSLGKALLMPVTAKADDREAALRDLTTDNLPADVCAYASFFRGNLFKKEKRNPEALEAYLDVSCRFPSGGLAVMAASEVQAAELLILLGRRDEATALLRSAARDGVGTVLVADVNKRLESLK
jgi:predicted Zn-dependent protease